MAKQICIRCYASGKVQGVWYRANTKEQADLLGVTGWASNLPDGRVEVVACGDIDKLERLHEWLKHGPPLANVTDLSYEELPWQEFKGFETR